MEYLVGLCVAVATAGLFAGVGFDRDRSSSSIVLMANVAAFAIVALFVAYMNRFQIAPEERALRARFGADFAVYCNQVRRWV